MMRITILMVFLLLLKADLVFSQGNEIIMPVSHRKKIEELIISPNGEYAVSADWNNGILWEIASGLSVRTFKYGRTNAREISFSPTGDTLSVCNGNTLTFIDVRTGKDLFRYSIAKLAAAYFSNRSGEMITVSDNKIMRINYPVGKVISKAEFEDYYLMHFSRLVLAKNEERLFIQGKGSLSAINLATGQRIFYNEAESLQDIECFAESIDGNSVATVSANKALCIYDVVTGTLQKKFTVNITPGNVLYTKNNEIVVYGYNLLEIYDVVSGEMLHHEELDKYYSKEYFQPDPQTIVLVNSRSVIGYDHSIRKVRFQYELPEKISYSNVAGQFGKSFGYNTARQLLLASDTTSLVPIVFNVPKQEIKRRLDIKGIPDLRKVVLAQKDSTTLLYTGYEDFCAAWNLQQAKKVFQTAHTVTDGSYAAATSLGTEMQLSPSGNWLVVGFNDYFNLFNFNTNNTCEIFSTADHRKKYVMPDVADYDISANNQFLYQRYTNDTLERGILNLVTGKEKLISRGAYRAKLLSISPSGRLAAFMANDHIYVYNSATNRLIKGDSFINWRPELESIAFSPDEKTLLVFGTEAVEIPIFETQTGKLLHMLQPPGETSGQMVEWVSYLPGSSYVMARIADNYFRFDIRNKQAKKITFPYRALTQLTGDTFWALDANADTLVYGRFVNDTARVLRYIKVPPGEITVKGNDLVVNNGKGVVWYKITTADTIQFMAELYSINADNAMFLTRPWYTADKKATETLHFLKGNNILSFEQLDVEFNRPDKVLTALGSKDTALIYSYKRAYFKRLQRMGIDSSLFTSAYTIPRSVIVNRDSISYEQNHHQLQLVIKGSDTVNMLRHLNVWVNESPVFGIKGQQVAYGHTIDTTLTITLSSGENRIEASVTNVTGIESYRIPVFVKYTPAVPSQQQVYFIGIGINHFKQAGNDLTWSVKDIRDLSLKLKQKYPSVIIDTLFDEKVTKENIVSLKSRLLQLKEDDKVIISYSGHGILSKQLDYYLSTYDIDFNQPAAAGLPYESLENLLDGIRPRQKLVLIDACHSGEVDKDEVARIDASRDSLNKMGTRIKSSIKVVPKPGMGIANSFQLMQNLFVNVSRGTGATIISAAGGMQYAQERGDLKNGVFTYSIIDAFNKYPSLKVSQLKDIVSEAVTKLTNGLQRPTSRNQTNKFDWVVW